jgi:NAD(P)-dependent dehydrogenase (short-subunit alcohol dehydrogenase family)
VKLPYDDAVVLVTGASTGLGRAIAVGAAERGAKAVIINFASNEEAANTTAALVREHGAEAVVVRGDVGADVDCRRIAAVAEPYGRIDTLFNNAAISRDPTYGDLDAVSADDFLDLYRVNVVGPFQMIRASRALLEAAEAPAVVNTSSLAGVTGSGSSMPYTASKGALNTMTRSLAIALAPRIRVNTICPGFIDSTWFDKFAVDGGTERLREYIRGATALQTVSTPEDVAEGALFFGSRAARHTTGETMLIDAGLHLGAKPSAQKPD